MDPISYGSCERKPPAEQCTTQDAQQQQQQQLLQQQQLIQELRSQHACCCTNEIRLRRQAELKESARVDHMRRVCDVVIVSFFLIVATVISFGPLVYFLTL
jgi:hypothetical protein